MPRKKGTSTKKVSTTKKTPSLKKKIPATKKKAPSTAKKTPSKPTLKPIKDYYSDEGVYTVHSVSDMTKSKEFYEKILELEKNYEAPIEIGWCEYKLPVKDAYLGLNIPQDKKVTPVSVLNITTNDLEATKMVLESKKIKTTDIMDIPDMISMFSIEDPDNNQISFLGKPRITSKK